MIGRFELIKIQFDSLMIKIIVATNPQTKLIISAVTITRLQPREMENLIFWSSMTMIILGEF